MITRLTTSTCRSSATETVSCKKKNKQTKNPNHRKKLKNKTKPTENKEVSLNLQQNGEHKFNTNHGMRSVEVQGGVIFVSLFNEFFLVCE